jgi:hypothetical protein
MAATAKCFTYAVAMWLLFATALAALAQTRTQLDSKFGSPESSEQALHRRALDAVIRHTPIVSVDAMRQAFFRDAGAKYGDIVWWSSTDWKNQTVTPSAATRYFYFNFNTKDGPVVVDLPTGDALFGTLFDSWQVPLIDVGPTGKDHGRGGKYLLLPPGYKHSVPAGYIPVPSQTYNGYALLRAIPSTSPDADVAKAVVLGKKLRLYPLAQAANPPEPRFIDMAGKLFDGIVRFDESFFASLGRMVNEERVQAHDPALAALLQGLRIDKGKQIQLNAQTLAALKQALGEAKVQLRQALTEHLEVFWPGSRWSLHAVGARFTIAASGDLHVEARRLMHFLAEIPRAKLGEATIDLVSVRDVQDQPLQGTDTYHLRVPPNLSAQQFWDLTVYDRETQAFIRESPRVGLDSNGTLQTNADGTVDIYFGPKVPASKETNWIYTAADREWFAIFRFYGPQDALLEKTWKLPDIEKIDAGTGVRVQ